MVICKRTKTQLIQSMISVSLRYAQGYCINSRHDFDIYHNYYLRTRIRNGQFCPAELTMLQQKLKDKKAAHQTMETRAVCKTCRKDFWLPASTTAYRCPACQTASTDSISRNGHCGVRNSIRRLGAKIFRHDQPESHRIAKKSASLLKYQQPDSSSLSRRCNKRAVLCGITYRSRTLRLRGTTNDVRNMKELLMETFKFPQEGILVLTERENDIRPTKKNILESLHWLVKDCQPGDSLVFYFSGHGLQQPDLQGDEIDGLDETLCPVDFLREGMIVDNDINSILVGPLVKGVTLHAIVDACHSGTILDLTYVYDKKEFKWIDNSPPAKEPMKKHTSGGLAICLSACLDTQVAADTTAFGKEMNGALTYLFAKTIRENPGITYGGILDKIDEEVQQIMIRKCQHGILKRFFRNKISQESILSSSETFDVYRKKFTL
ncbi:hypothetical protein L6164_036336 [Bauhinia variegata]|uniref:Uncharacterized protein n=1 Tax=Bauhinia variegata TaxID=167791 RepID=A0ACB9KGP6_BAUVA|nr:hypothetical protein L6164_036336 [Bauhinia variegata]